MTVFAKKKKKFCCIEKRSICSAMCSYSRLYHARMHILRTESTGGWEESSLPLASCSNKVYREKKKRPMKLAHARYRKFQQSMYHPSLPVQLYVHFRPASIISRDMVAIANPLTCSRDLMYSVQINRWLLKPIGVWPISLCVTTREKISSIMLALISSFLISFLLVPCALCTILETGDLDTKIKMIGPLSFCVMAAIKYYILVSRGAKIGKCIEDIRADWCRAHSRGEEDRRIMRENAKIGRSLATLCVGFM